MNLYQQRVLAGLRARGARGGIVLAGEVGAAALGLAATTLSVRYVGLAEFGRFGIAAAIVATIGLVLDIRVEDVASRRFQEEGASGSHAKQVWTTYYLADVLFGIARYVLLLALLPLLSLLYGDADLFWVVACLGVGITVSSADNSVVTALNVQKRSGVIALARVSTPLLRLCLVLALKPGGALGLATIAFIGAVVSTLVLVIGGRRLFTRPLDRMGVLTELKRSGPTVSQISVARTLLGAGSQADVLVVGALLGQAPTGIYQLARTFAAAPAMVASVIRFIEVPRAMAEAIRRDYAALKNTFTRVSIACGLFGLLCLVAWLALGGTIVRQLIGAQALEVSALTAILLVAATLDYATYWSKIVPAALDRGKLALLESVWHGPARLAFILLLTGPFGLAGAATASVVVSGIASAGWLFFLRHLDSTAVPALVSKGAWTDGARWAPAQATLDLEAVRGDARIFALGRRLPEGEG